MFGGATGAKAQLEASQKAAQREKLNLEAGLAAEKGGRQALESELHRMRCAVASGGQPSPATAPETPSAQVRVALQSFLLTLEGEGLSVGGCR